MPLQPSTLRLFKLGLLHEALFEVMGLLYGCESSNFDVSKGGEGNRATFR